MSDQDDENFAMVPWLVGSPVGGLLVGKLMSADCGFNSECTEAFNTLAGMTATLIGWGLTFAYAGYKEDPAWYGVTAACAGLAIFVLVSV